MDKYFFGKLSGSIMLCLLASPFFSLQAQNTIASRIDSLLSRPFFDTTSVSVSVFNLTKGRETYSFRNKLLFRPASNMKILTTTAALYFLGGDYNFNTSFYRDGAVEDSVLKGNLYVVGHGDPDFSTEDLDTIVMKISAAGIKRIEGNLYGDVTYTDSIFWGHGWMWDDDPSTDSPYLSALNINSNSVLVTMQPGAPGEALIVSTTPATGFFSIRNSAVTAQDTPYTFKWDRNWLARTNELIFTGRFPAASGMRRSEINVYNPAMYFLTLLSEKLNNAGIGFSGSISLKKLTGSPELLAEKNRKYSEVIINLNKTSDNLSAEMTLRAMAARFFGVPALPENGIVMTDSLLTLAGLNKDNYRIVDGSGVSHYNLVSSELFMNVLKFIYYARPEKFSLLYDSFPVAGIDGTLRGRMKGTKAYNNVHAKTGTLSGVSSLSGYVRNSAGELQAFSIMMQGYIGSSRKATGWQDRICAILAE